MSAHLYCSIQRINHGAVQRDDHALSIRWKLNPPKPSACIHLGIEPTNHSGQFLRGTRSLKPIPSPQLNSILPRDRLSLPVHCPGELQSHPAPVTATWVKKKSFPTNNSLPFRKTQPRLSRPRLSQLLGASTHSSPHPKTQCRAELRTSLHTLSFVRCLAHHVSRERDRSRQGGQFLAPTLGRSASEAARAPGQGEFRPGRRAPPCQNSQSDCAAAEGEAGAEPPRYYLRMGGG
jgi:hypothetical protein